MSFPEYFGLTSEGATLPLALKASTSSAICSEVRPPEVVPSTVLPSNATWAALERSVISFFTLALNSFALLPALGF